MKSLTAESKSNMGWYPVSCRKRLSSIFDGIVFTIATLAGSGAKLIFASGTIARIERTNAAAEVLIPAKL
jgi:hypothetical protein